MFALSRRLSNRYPAAATLLAVAAVWAGCSGGQSTGTTGAFTTLGPTAGAETAADPTESAPDTDSDPPSSSSSTGDPLPPTTGAESSDGGATSSTGGGNDDGESSTTDVEPVRPQPRTGWWSHCTPGISCGDGLVCMVDESETNGACTSQCTPAGDTTSCAPSPGGTSSPTCLTVSASSICALDCSGGKTCPGGMICLSDADDTGPIEICI